MPRCTCSDPTHFHPGEEEGDWLYIFIDVPKVTCLNEKIQNSGQAVFKHYDKRTETTSKILEAEDGELLLRVPFTEMVKLKSFQLIPVNEETMPKKIKFFLNRNDIDFNNVDSMKPVQVVENIPFDINGEVDNPLIPSKFTAVESVIMHITGTEDELLQISCIGFKGESKGFNPKVVEGIKYEIRAQMKDHIDSKADKTGKSDIA